MTDEEPDDLPGERRKGMKTREIVFLAVMAVCLVVAIVPYIRKGQSEAANIRSLNNLVQWGIGLNLYLIDHENRLPQIGPSQPLANSENTWYQALPPYLSQKTYSELKNAGHAKGDLSAQIWNDPAIERMFGEAPSSFIFPYAMNRWLQPVPDLGAYAIYDVVSPRSVVFMTETASTDPGVLPAAVSYRHGRKPTSPAAETNVLFVDGHVAPVTREVLSAEPDTALDAPLPTVSWLPYSGAPEPTVVPGDESEGSIGGL